MDNNTITIGLFGTCGSSTWRTAFVSAFDQQSIPFFNPQLPEGVWTPDRADEFVQAENKNLKSNDIVLFPVTDETTGQGSLAEIGFSVMDTIRNLNGRKLIVLVDLDCKCPKSTPAQIEESKRSRVLVRSKVADEAFVNPNVFLVDSIEEMYELTFKLYRNMTEYSHIKQEYLKAV